MHASLNVNCSSHCSFLILTGECSQILETLCNNLMKVWSVVYSCYMSNKSMVKLIFTYLLTCLLIPCIKVLLEKLTGFQLVKKFPAFYTTWRFITTFTSANHLPLSWASLIHSIPPHPTFWRSILILPSHLCLGLPSGLFSSGFPGKANRYIFVTLHFEHTKNRNGIQGTENIVHWMKLHIGSSFWGEVLGVIFATHNFGQNFVLLGL